MPETNGDITDASVQRVRKDTERLRPTSITLYKDTKMAKVTFNEIDNADAIIGKRKEGGVLIQNIVDDPETPGVDETDNRFTQLIAHINNNSNFWHSVSLKAEREIGVTT